MCLIFSVKTLMSLILILITDLIAVRLHRRVLLANVVLLAQLDLRVFPDVLAPRDHQAQQERKVDR